MDRLVSDDDLGVGVHDMGRKPLSMHLSYLTHNLIYFEEYAEWIVVLSGATPVVIGVLVARRATGRRLERVIILSILSVILK